MEEFSGPHSVQRRNLPPKYGVRSKEMSAILLLRIVALLHFAPCKYVLRTPGADGEDFISIP